MRVAHLAPTLPVALALTLGGCAAPPGPLPNPDAPLVAATCAELREPVSADTLVRVPAGVSSITLCDTTAEGLSRQILPGQALTTDLDAVVAAWAALPAPASGARTCPADLGPRFTLILAYPDGRHRGISGELYGCRMVGGRIGATEVMDALQSAYAKQRASKPVPGAPCTSATWLTADLRRTRAASVVNRETGRSASVPGWPALVAALPAPEFHLNTAEFVASPVQLVAADGPDACVTVDLSADALWTAARDPQHGGGVHRWGLTVAQRTALAAVIQAVSAP